jgi:hypothetical protein
MRPQYISISDIVYDTPKEKSVTILQRKTKEGFATLSYEKRTVKIEEIDINEILKYQGQM